MSNHYSKCFEFYSGGKLKQKSFFSFVLLITLLTQACSYSDKDVKTGYIKVRDSKIYYEEVGEGMPLILSHAGLMDLKMWDEHFLNYANNGYRVIRYDSFGHGKTIDGENSPLFDEIIKSIIDELQLVKVNLAGVSMGGTALIDFALEHPNNVNKLVLISTGIYGYNWAEDKLLVPLLQDFMYNVSEGDTLKSVESFLKAWTDGPYRKPNEVSKNVRKKSFDMILNKFRNHGFSKNAMNTYPRAIERYKDISCPVLIIYGDKDMPSIVKISNMLKRELKNAKMAVVKNAGHLLNMENPDEFDSLIVDFLGENEK